ncbi:MAG: class I SAM-dependent methyltransferase [Bdellovibrionota bacterium]
MAAPIPGDPALGLPELFSLYPFPLKDPAAFLELSFGAVLVMRELLEKTPQARLVCLVPDERREKWARGKLESLSSRARFVRADPAEGGWSGALPEGFHFIAVSWGIEEVAPGKRMDLVRRLAEKLRPGGMLAVLAAVETPKLLTDQYRLLLKEDAPLPPLPAEGSQPDTEGRLKFLLEAANLRPADLFWKKGPYALVFGMKAV